MSNQAADWYSEQEYRERCGMPHEGESMPKQKISNGDKIRNMTDEELAVYFRTSICNHIQDDICGMVECDECIIQWLKQESDNE